ncbi:MAG: PIG-L deacetylase family protein [Pseudomonadota bacterium]
MSDISHLGKVLVIAPHPDDEVLGCGGTMARLTDAGHEVHVALVTRGYEPAFPDSLVQQVRAEMAESHRLLGVEKCHFCELPAAALDTVPGAEINAKIGAIVEEVAPDTMFIPFLGDIHKDHQLIFVASLVAARPRSRKVPNRVYAYETLSETNWAAPGITETFIPNVFFDVSSTIERKLEAFACFKSQVKQSPDERSFKTIESLATVRGSTAFLDAAEAFMLIREIA